MDEPIRQDRRYKWFRPRQAARGRIQINPTNYGTLSLFNNSTGAYYLIVRGFGFADTTSGDAVFMWLKTQQGSLGSSGGTIQPVIADGAALAGALYSSDQTAQITPNYIWCTTQDHDQWNALMPWLVLPPQYSFIAQLPILNTVVALNITWEAIEPDELDWMY